MTIEIPPIRAARPLAKFADPDWTAKGEPRAKVPLVALRTLWFNTGTLCNITCRNCYIESSPSNDRLVYLSVDEVRPFLAEAAGLGVEEIGFTGGEPFLNPEFLDMLGETLKAGFAALVLTNAMVPMQRPPVKEALRALRAAYGSRLTLRVSLDHFSADLHDEERGAGSFERTVAGIDWLASEGFRIAIAGRSCWGETRDAAMAGYQALFSARQWPLDATCAGDLVIFPEMDLTADVPEITPACWGLLNKRPDQMMCASSRMVVKRRGAAGPVVLPCTLIAYEPAFDMGATLSEAATVDGGVFDAGAVKLAHPHCSKFCVLGGGSCS